jgi:hypothetical protein
MAYLSAYEYDGAKGINFKADEGAFTENTDDPYGGSWATPLKPGMWVSLVSAKTMCVKKAASGEIPIGVVVGKPRGGNRTRYSRDVAVDLIGCRVMEIEIDKTSANISVGDPIEFVDAGGVYGLGTFRRDEDASHVAQPNGTYCLAPLTVDANNGGQLIPVLFMGPQY